MKFIAIVGSLEQGRNYDPALHQPSEGRKAAEEVGRVLAKAGFGLIVYSAEREFVEGDVVRGYVRSGRAKPKSIIVHFPAGALESFGFPERTSHPNLFDLRQDTRGDWEVSFYRSLASSDGIFLIGGGRSTLVSGVVALAYRLPLIVLAAYGGAASKVWSSLTPGRDLLTDEAIHSMAEPFSEPALAKWQKSFRDQLVIKRNEDKGSGKMLAATWALILLITWVAVLPIGFTILPNLRESSPDFWHRSLFIFLVFLTPLIAGASGATIRALRPGHGIPNFQSTVLGMAAGAVASVLYVLGQLIGNSTPYNFNILAFSVGFGFVAGFTFDVVFKQLESLQALKADALK